VEVFLVDIVAYLGVSCIVAHRCDEEETLMFGFNQLWKVLAHQGSPTTNEFAGFCVSGQEK